MTIWHRDMAWLHSRAKGVTRLVLMALAEAAGKDDLTSLTAKEIVAKTGCGVRSVPRALGQLEALGEIRAVKRFAHRPTEYRICLKARE